MLKIRTKYFTFLRRYDDADIMVVGTTLISSVCLVIVALTIGLTTFLNNNLNNQHTSATNIGRSEVILETFNVKKIYLMYYFICKSRLLS